MTESYLIRPDDFQQELEDRLVPEGEYELRIVKADFGASKSGENNVASILCSVQGPEGDNASPIGHWIVWPNKDADARANRQRTRDIKRFLTVFGWPLDQGFDPEANIADLQGAEGKCFVRQEKNKDTGEVYNRLRLPRLDA